MMNQAALPPQRLTRTWRKSHNIKSLSAACIASVNMGLRNADTSGAALVLKGHVAGAHRQLLGSYKMQLA